MFSVVSALSEVSACHHETQDKVERWHQTLKDRILLENYFLPGDLDAQIEAFVDKINLSPSPFVGQELT